MAKAAVKTQSKVEKAPKASKVVSKIVSKSSSVKKPAVRKQAVTASRSAASKKTDKAAKR